MAPGVVPPAILLPSVVLNSAFAPRLPGQVSQKRLKRHSSYCMEPFPRMRPMIWGSQILSQAARCVEMRALRLHSPIIVDSKRVLRPGDSLGAERDSPLADARVAAVEGPLA